MKITKNIGIWMDYSTASLIEFKSESFEIKSIDSGFSNQKEIEILDKTAGLIHHEENEQLSTYYKRIAEQIKGYTEVVLFGSTDAKAELFTVLNQEEPFRGIKMEIKNTEKMTDNQKKYFVKSYFSEV